MGTARALENDEVSLVVSSVAVAVMNLPGETRGARFFLSMIGNESGKRSTSFADHDIFTSENRFEKLGKSSFGLVDIDKFHV